MVVCEASYGQLATGMLGYQNGLPWSNANVSNTERWLSFNLQ